MMMRARTRGKDVQDSVQTPAKSQFRPRPFAASQPERESLNREVRFGHSIGDIDLLPKATIQLKEGGEDSSNTCAIGGLKPGAEEDEFIGGRKLGEVIGDGARPVGTAVGNVVGSVVGVLTGISISSMTNVGPSWGNHGRFNWQVGYNTTGRNGWLVQEIVNTYRAQDAVGNNLGGPHPTPQYWEAWAVDGAGNVTPNVGADNDYYRRPNKGNNTEGHWSMRGKVYFSKMDPATQGFAAGNVPDAGILPSTTTAPNGLGIARLHRYAQGTWSSTGATPGHTGSAGP